MDFVTLPSVLLHAARAEVCVWARVRSKISRRMTKFVHLLVWATSYLQAISMNETSAWQQADFDHRVIESLATLCIASCRGIEEKTPSIIIQRYFKYGDIIKMVLFQFRTIFSTSECLFSLINGDEIYGTLSMVNLDEHPSMIYWFSRAYIYSFVIMFIFAVANLFIAVINDSYEAIKVWTIYLYIYLLI